MPYRDRTGPRGRGPMSGKATGYCVEKPADTRPGSESGMGRDVGKGRGRCYRGGATNISDAVPAATREQELEELQRQAGYLKTAGEEISARIKAVETRMQEA